VGTRFFRLIVSSQSTRLTDRRTDRQKGLGNTVRCITCSCAVKVTKLCYFNQDNPPPFLSILSCLHRWSVGGSEKSRFVGDEMRMQTWRWTELLLGVTTFSSHDSWLPIGSQRLAKLATASMTCSCGSSSQMVCRATFNSSVVLGFGWSLWYFSSIVPDVIVLRFRSGEPLFLLNELVHLQSVLHDARTLRNGVVLVETT